ncbi:site-specific DNA-methyltransferase [Pseudomonas sp. v388]|uniref:site-specific DNA-methyltransferase n=1 Tax=Pseudomonas sp. v388 TaxID=2479849 RepID=UPI000F76D82E|nr:site-specific DNA-methyltransferase [Pseudomonas sp. v388]RRV04157.1 site-specific DNA-methyltransferase [Pseudomonas sp. v388]
MEKMKMHSPNLTQDNVARIRELFPSCVTESQGEDGVVRLAVDFDQLRQELSGSVVEGPQERYHLNWPGKREALLTANAPIAKTLRPCREDSVNFETTQNLFIEGDNLEALKLLQEVYLNKVSLIYIDPPYNTGGDFIYEDDFAEDVDTYLYRSNQRGEVGDRMIANPESNGRIHSDWLSMIYSRLRLARSLLRDDGLIFISIDDNEQANLQKVCDEIFGESNFRGKVSRATGTPSGQGHGILVNEVDFILIYSKSEEATLYGLPFTSNDQKIYDQQDEFGRYLTRTLRKTGGEDRREDRPTMYYSVEAPDGGKVFPIGPGGYESRWRCGPKNYEELKSNNLIEWKQVAESGVQVWKPYQKFYLEGRLKQPSNLWQNIEGNKKASIDIKSLFGAKVFDTPKPIELIKRCISIGMQSDGIVVDFFAGSATTAHAVMALNAEDQGTRRYVMIQLPEACPEDSEAYKNGYSKISDIGKERIRRAGTKIKAAHAMTVPDLDTGFRTLKVDTSNMKEVYYNPDAVSQDLLSDQVDNIRKDRTAEDLLFQVLLDWGVDLALPISQQSIAGKTVFFVDGNALVACFDTGIDEDFVKQLAGHQPLRVVFRDSGFASDSVKINVEQVFKLLSPATEIKTL